ncbi:MAG: hypothetical protein K6F94_01555 [Bacteroidaceae bacterium]|nr:hypothetical protein [Bacteroidaceae bacterium]
MNPIHRSVLICSVLHLLVDGMCGCALYLMASDCGAADILSVFVVYNLWAFLSQPLTGSVADRTERQGTILLSSAALLTVGALGCLAAGKNAAWAPSGWFMAVSATLMGMGNSLFHVWGGRAVALQSDNDMRSLGVFVSTGALGLAAGMVLCSLALLFGLQAAVWVGVWMMYSRGKCEARERETSAVGLPLVSLLLLAIMSFVMFRSYVGGVFAEGIERTDRSIMILAAVTMFGKMAGGFISKAIGWVPAALLSLLVVAVCAYIIMIGGADTCGSLGSIPLGATNVAVIGGIFAINCTMPITLYLANRLLPRREGLAFGLLAAALIPPYLIALT